MLMSVPLTLMGCLLFRLRILSFNSQACARRSIPCLMYKRVSSTWIWLGSHHLIHQVFKSHFLTFLRDKEQQILHMAEMWASPGQHWCWSLRKKSDGRKQVLNPRILDIISRNPWNGEQLSNSTILESKKGNTKNKLITAYLQKWHNSRRELRVQKIPSDYVAARRELEVSLSALSLLPLVRSTTNVMAHVWMNGHCLLKNSELGCMMHIHIPRITHTEGPLLEEHYYIQDSRGVNILYRFSSLGD